MTSPPKPRRKKTLEPLDWRELAEGPALRGLTEVLSASPEIARQRASKRAEIEANPAATASITPSPTVGVSPAVGGAPGLEASAAGTQRSDGDFPALLERAAPMLHDAPTVGETPTVEDPASSAVRPTTVVETPTVGESPAESHPPETEARAITYGSTGASEAFSGVDSPSEGGCPTEVESSTAGVSPSVGGSLQFPSPKQTVTEPGAARRQIWGSGANSAPYRPSRVPPTVGVSPSAPRYTWWVDSAGTRYEGKRVQRVVIAQHSMSLGEERVYQTLWHGRESDGVFIETKKSKTFSLGYDRIARLVRLNEKSVRVLLPKLIHKKILEVVAAENSASRLGRTYRIFNYEEILERQRAANLTNVVKNGRAVEFVWPENPTVGDTPTVSVARKINDLRSTEVDTPTVGPTYPDGLARKVQAIVSSFDDDAVRTLWAKCIQRAPDCSAEEVEYCLQLKAHQLLARGKAVRNAVGLMLWAVPKCFEGPAALHLAYREQKRAEEEARRRAEEQFQTQMEEYRRLAADPQTSPEDRAWYEDLLRGIS